MTARPHCEATVSKPLAIASGRAYAPRVLRVMVPFAARLAMSPALKPTANSSLCLAMPSLI